MEQIWSCHDPPKHEDSHNSLSAISTPSSIWVTTSPKGSDSKPCTLKFNHVDLLKSEYEIVLHAIISDEIVEHESELLGDIESDKREIDDYELFAHKYVVENNVILHVHESEHKKCPNCITKPILSVIECNDLICNELAYVSNESDHIEPKVLDAPMTLGGSTREPFHTLLQFVAHRLFIC